MVRESEALPYCSFGLWALLVPLAIAYIPILVTYSILSYREPL